MRPCAAVIFDMDGVIVDSEPRHERAFLEVLTELGYGDTHGLRFADYIGRTDRDLWVDFVKKHNPPQPLEELLARKRRRVVDILRRDQPLFDGLPELVASLAGKYPLAVASGSERMVVDEVLALRACGGSSAPPSAAPISSTVNRLRTSSCAPRSCSELPRTSAASSKIPSPVSPPAWRPACKCSQLPIPTPPRNCATPPAW